MTFFEPTLWIEARKRSALAREQLRRQVLDQLKSLLQSLKGKYCWQELYLFGSIITPGTFTETSDVDVAVSGLEKQALYSLTADLSRALGREVDVLILEESPIAERIRHKGIVWETRKP